MPDKNNTQQLPAQGVSSFGLFIGNWFGNF